jgi:hypothetical protein
MARPDRPLSGWERAFLVLVMVVLLGFVAFMLFIVWLSNGF